MPEPPLLWAVQVPLLQKEKKKKKGFTEPGRGRPLRFLVGVGDRHGHGGLAAIVGKGTAGRRRDGASPGRAAAGSAR